MGNQKQFQSLRRLNSQGHRSSSPHENLQFCPNFAQLFSDKNCQTDTHNFGNFSRKAQFYGREREEKYFTGTR
jgi:hypothetical protein